MRRIVILALGAALSACQFINVKIGNGVPVETILEVGDFNAISLSSSMDVVYTQTPGAQSLKFVCDENLQEYYDIRVEGNTLKVGLKPGTMNLSRRVNTILTVNSPVLNAVKVSGSGDVSIGSSIKADDGFSLQVSGSGDISVDGPVTCGTFAASTNGSGEIDLIGISAESVECKVSGSGDISIDGPVTCGTYAASTSGSGSIEVDALVAEGIRATISGSGDIRLTGLAAGDITASTSGSGEIILAGIARNLSARSTGSGRIDSDQLSLER